MAHDDAVATAWRLHASLADWIGRIDAKASFALTIESAVLAGVGALAGTHHGVGDLSGWWARAALWIGVAALALAALAAVSAVVPRAGTRRMEPPGPDDYLFYGHIRRWTPHDLAEHLSRADPLSALTNQLVIMSDIAWVKHRRVQHSLALAVSGVVFLALAVITG
ncbi:Pycsar system effector family protein [Streptomyces sp. NPDC008125]|uniref:Pycsar system effector family protein n=1 Tax=Streptomyces sp. NPDC008125 TaxID=3364811 RepID=UPI0036EF50A6